MEYGEIKIERYKYNNIPHFSEKAMAPHSSTLAWKIPWMEEPGRLQSMGSLRIRHDWATSLSLITFMHWRRKWQPTPVFLPGESQGRGSLVGCHLWGRTESDTTERLHFHFHHIFICPLIMLVLVVWSLQVCFFSKLLWPFGVFYGSTQISSRFFLFLWETPLELW